MKVTTAEPPMCAICDRRVRETSLNAIGPGVECCGDCYFAWYDVVPEEQNNKAGIKKYVLETYGPTGGEGVEWEDVS